MRILKSKIEMSLILRNIKNILLALSYGYKLKCVDDKFSKLFKSYLREGAVYNFISSMIEESKYCTDLMKKKLTKNLR